MSLEHELSVAIDLARQAGAVLLQFYSGETGVEWKDEREPVTAADRAANALIVEELARDFSGRLKVMKMNVDENPQIPMNLHVTGIPTVLLFKNGRIVDQAVGSAPKRMFVDMIEKHLD